MRFWILDFGFWIGTTLLLSACSASELQKIDKPEALEDFSWVSREAKKLPAFKSEKPRFTIWALGEGKKSAMIMAWDESLGTGKGYDTFYFDTNFNGDLTEEGKCFHGKKFALPPIKEADGPRVFKIAVVFEGDNFDWQSTFYVESPTGGYNVGLLPGNLKIQWANSLKDAPVYHFGGRAILHCSGKNPGESLGKWTAGTMAEVWTDLSLVGNANCLLRFYHSHVPGGEPQIMLRVQDKNGAKVEDVAFTGGCGCAGSFGKSLQIPSRVPPGAHTLVVRVDRSDFVGGPAEFNFPVEIDNPDYGKPLNDPAFLALKTKCSGASIASLRRVAGPGQDLKGFQEETVVAARACDNSLYGATRDWDMSSANQGAEPMLSLGPQIHHHVDARTLMKFDLSMLPKDVKISGAQLRLTLTSQPFTGCKPDAKISAYALKQDWSEEESCWKSPKKNAAWGVLGCDDTSKDRAAEPAGSVDVGVFPNKDERYRFVAIDLTELVQKWQSGELPNYGVFLKLTGGGCVKLYSSEFQDYPFRPTLLLASQGAPLKPVVTMAADEDLEAARARAASEKKPLLVKFYSPTCGVCQKVQKTTFADKAVKDLLAGKFSFVNLKIEDNAQLAQTLGVGSVPAAVIFSPDGKTKTALLESSQLQDAKSLVKTLEAIKLP
jgi:thiol-disulfide isomerase/thioredoxin